ncbi:MAG: hypothetical protein KAH57_05530 [Thermoplasmata archaeon]|nr:hypothetical protein [Thermoplasmata archaeon]
MSSTSEKQAVVTVMGIKFGRQRGRVPGAGAVWLKRLKAVLSGVVITLSLFTFLTALSQVLIHAMAVNIFDENNFQNWWSAPLLPFLFSVALLILFIIINYDRVPILRDAVSKLKGARAPKTHKDIELPEFD